MNTRCNENKLTDCNVHIIRRRMVAVRDNNLKKSTICQICLHTKHTKHALFNFIFLLSLL
jgi:hypothetical protein